MKGPNSYLIIVRISQTYYCVIQIINLTVVRDNALAYRKRHQQNQKFCQHLYSSHNSTQPIKEIKSPVHGVQIDDSRFIWMLALVASSILFPRIPLSKEPISS